MTKITSDDIEPTGRERALAAHQGGKFAEAAAMYEALLRTDTADADLWWLLSIAQLRLGRSDEALATWRKCLSIEKAVPLRLRNITNFLLIMQRTAGIETQPLDFLDGLDIPDWPKDLSLDQDSESMILALARCLIDLGRKEAALQLLDSIVADRSGDPGFLVAIAPLMIGAGRPEKMLEFLRPLTSDAHRGNAALLIAHAAAAAVAQYHEEAEIMSRRAREAVPVFLSAEMPKQRMLIGVLNEVPKVIKEAYSAAQLHFHRNTPAALSTKMNDEFRFLSIFPQAESAREALAAVPQPRLIINNWVNPEILARDGVLDFIAGYADSLALPVINHPRRAHLTTRQHNAERLAGIPNLLVPRILRVPNDPQKSQSLIRLIGEELGFPVIMRSTFTQEGAATEKIETPAELAAYLSTARNPQLYAIQYIHNPLPEGAYRKFRAAVIGSELIMLQVRFGALWNVHRDADAKVRAKVMDFDAKGTAAAFALKALQRPEEALGKPAMATLDEIRARTPLDFFGIDFDLLPDGRVLFFETNTAMNFGLRENEDLPEVILAIKKAFRQLFENPPRRIDVTSTGRG